MITHREIMGTARRHIVILLLLLIVSIGIFLRTYHFYDWMYFQGDQVRDAMLVGKAVENGPGWLPLLGPKAGGTSLRLGPVFYYFQYLSGALFHSNDPHVLAYPDLLFGVLTVVLLFFLLREFFPRSWSLALTLGYAVCFFAVQYSRFAWNPNSLPFFNLLFFFAVFKFFNVGEMGRKRLWIAVAAVAYAVASQLHYVSMLSLPIAAVLIAIGYKAMNRDRRIGFKGLIVYAIPVVCVLAIFYLPVVLSDMSTGWNNTLNFFSSIGTKSSNSSFLKLVGKEAFNFFKYASIVLSGIIDAHNNTYYSIGSFFLFGSALASIALLKRLRERKTKLFILIAWVWLVSYVLMYFTVADSLQPRHFLVVAPLFFVFWGMIIFAFVPAIRSTKISVAAIMLLLIPAFLNVYSVKTWFSELADSQKIISNYRKSNMLKVVGGDSWWHFERVAEFMHDDCKESELVIMPPKRTSQSSVKFVTRRIDKGKRATIFTESLVYNPNACYYAVYFAKNGFPERFFDEKSGMSRLYWRYFGDVGVVRFSFSNPEKAKQAVRDLARKNYEETAGASAETDGTEQGNDAADISDDSDASEMNAEAENILESEIIAASKNKPDNWATRMMILLHIPLPDAEMQPRVFWKDLRSQ